MVAHLTGTVDRLARAVSTLVLSVQVLVLDEDCAILMVVLMVDAGAPPDGIGGLGVGLLRIA